MVREVLAILDGLKIRKYVSDLLEMKNDANYIKRFQMEHKAKVELDEDEYCLMVALLTEQGYHDREEV